MVDARSPERDIYLAQVLEEVRNRLAELRINAEVTGRPKHLWSIYEKMVVKGKEFDEIFDLVGMRVIVDSVKDCYAALGLDPRHLEAGAGPLQGLRGDAEVQPVPVAPHHRGGTPGQTDRGADPNLGDARPRRTRRRRALELQGSRSVEPGRGHGLAQRHHRLAAGDVGSRRVHAEPEGRSRAGRGLRLHAQGQRRHLGQRRHAGRLRLRHPHRGGPRVHRRPPQRPSRPARLQAVVG